MLILYIKTQKISYMLLDFAAFFFFFLKTLRKNWTENIPASNFPVGRIAEWVFGRQVGLPNEKWSRTQWLAAHTLLAVTNVWLEKYRGNYIQLLSKSVTWHMWQGNKTANGGCLVRQISLMLGPAPRLSCLPLKRKGWAAELHPEGFLHTSTFKASFWVHILSDKKGKGGQLSKKRDLKVN